MRIPILAALLAASPGALAQTPPAPTLDPPTEAVRQDAMLYATQFAVPLGEAVRRLTAQEESVPATDAIAERYRDRLAGIVIEHVPAYRIVVHLTGTEPVAPSSVRTSGMTVPIVFVGGAKATREQVVWAMTWHQAELRAALPKAPGIGLDPATGELVVIVGTAQAPDGAEPIDRRLERIAGVPVQVRILNRVDRNLSISGGARVEGLNPADGRRYLCTTGFNVTDGTRSAVTTAAHCLDKLDYRDPTGGPAVPLEFVGQWGWGYRDVQVNASAGPLPPTFYADTAKTRLRTVTGMRTRAATRSGDFVCHRGERTGYSCASVELTDFAPAGDICGGACLPTWVTVAGPTCKAGDSGSPVFGGGTAFGILKGASYRGDGSCAFYFYMSVDYLPMGWRLLTQSSAIIDPKNRLP